MEKTLVVLLLLCALSLSEVASEPLPDVHAALRDFSSKLAKLEAQVEELQKGKQVAFSASLRSTEITLGPYNTHTPLVYTHVLTNIGNAYNPITGIFTAPVRGAYHFEYYFTANGQQQTTAAVLVKNGEHTFAAAERATTNGFGTGSNAATLLLEVGDTVFMRLWKGNTIYDNANHHSTFSGHLLFTM